MSQTHETCANLTLDLAQMGFGTTEQVKQFTEFLNKYINIKDTAKALNMLKLMRALATKYKDDAITSERSSERLFALKQELEEKTGKSISGADFFYAVIATTRNNGIMSLFGDNKQITSYHRKLAESMQQLNPQVLAQLFGQEMQQGGALADRLVTLMTKHSDVFSDGRLSGEVTANGDTLETIDDAMLHGLYATWADVIELLKPKDTAKEMGYQPIALDKMAQAVESSLAKASEEGRLSFKSDVDASIVSELVQGHYMQINKKFLLYRKLGIDVEFNPLYILPNMHNKNWLYQQRLLEIIGEETQKITGDKNAEVSQAVFDTAYERAIEEQAIRLQKYANHAAVFGEKWKQLERDLNFANNQVREVAEATMLARYRGMARTLYDSMHLTDDINQLDQVGRAATMKLSSPAQALIQRSYYFRDAEAQLAYIKETDKYMGGSDGAYLTKRLSSVTSTTQDLAILSLFGSNPSLTMRKFLSMTEDTTTTSASKSIFDTLSGSSVGHTYESIKQVLFPKDLTPVLDLTDEARETFNSLVKQVHGNEWIKQYLIKSAGTDAGGGLFERLSNPTYFAHLPLGALLEAFPAMIRPMLHLNTLVMDSATHMMHLAEVRTGALMAFEVVPNTFSLMKTVIMTNLRGITGADEASQLRYMVAKTTGVRESELTPELLSEVLAELGVLKESLQLLDRKHAHQQAEGRTNKVTHFLNSLNMNPMTHVLAGGDNTVAMFAVRLAGLHQANSVVKEMISDVKAGKKLSLLAQDYMIKFGLTAESLASLESVFGDFSNTKGLMDTARLTALINEDTINSVKEQLPPALIDKVEQVMHLRKETEHRNFIATTKFKLSEAYSLLKQASDNYQAVKSDVKDEEIELSFLSKLDKKEQKEFKVFQEKYNKTAQKNVSTAKAELDYQNRELDKMLRVNEKSPTALDVFEAFTTQNEAYRAFVKEVNNTQSFLTYTQDTLYKYTTKHAKVIAKSDASLVKAELANLKKTIAPMGVGLRGVKNVADLYDKVTHLQEQKTMARDEVTYISTYLQKHVDIIKRINEAEDIQTALEYVKEFKKLLREQQTAFSKLNKKLDANTVALMKKHNKRVDETALQEQNDLIVELQKQYNAAVLDRDSAINEETALRLGVFYNDKEIIPSGLREALLSKRKQEGRLEVSQEVASDALEAVRKASGRVVALKEASEYDFDTWMNKVHKQPFDDEESYIASKESEQHQLLAGLIENNAHAVVAMMNEITNDAGYKHNDSGELSQLLASSSTKGKVLNALFFHLKRFMLSAIHIDAKKYRTVYDAKGVAGVVSRATSYAMVMGSVGMLYQSIAGMLNNQATGLMGVYQDINNDSLEPMDKLIRVSGHVGKAVFYGMPVGGVLSTITYGLNMDKGVLGTLTDFMIAPTTSVLTKDAEVLKDTGELFSEDEEKRNKQTYKMITQALKNVPIANLMVPKALMSYGALPWLRESLEIESAGDAYRRNIESAIDTNNPIALGLPTSPLVGQSD